MEEPTKYLEYLKNNITKGWKTTVFGFVIFIAGIATMFLPESDVAWWQSLSIMLVGVFIAALKDPKKNNTNCIIIVVCSLTLFSCATEKRCLDKFGNKEISTERIENNDSTYVEYRDTTIYLPSDTVRTTIPSPCDSLGNLKNFHYTYRGKNNAVITASNNNGDLQLECLCEEEQVIITRQKQLISKLRKQNKTTSKISVITKKHIPWYAKWKLLLIYIISAYFIGRYRLDNKLLKLISKLFI